MIRIDCFKAYDVRGRVPAQLNEDIAWRIGQAYVEFLNPTTVAVGRDIRLSSPEIAAAFMRGVTDAGADVADIGIGGTELAYFATFSKGLDGGVMITASHNPPDYNGLKMVREQARPISADTGLMDIKALAEKGEFRPAQRKGAITPMNIMPDYIAHLLSYVEPNQLKPLRIVVNAGNGGAGPVVDLLEPHLPFEFIKIQHEPDGSFPNGVPNPMLEANRAVTAEAVRANKADFGVAWDGDYDRCFLFDETGEFVEGYYLVGLLSQVFLEQSPGASIVYDPRLTWNTLEVAKALNGNAVKSKSGHAFVKQVMRDADAVYGGEMSAHHYFKRFAYADSGMIPWLLISALMSRSGQPLSQLIGDCRSRFPISGEINRRVADAAATISMLEDRYAKNASLVEHVDGLGVEFDTWRFNVRASNTEPLLRLNVESRGDTALLQAKTSELLELIGGDPE